MVAYVSASIRGKKIPVLGTVPALLRPVSRSRTILVRMTFGFDVSFSLTLKASLSTQKKPPGHRNGGQGAFVCGVGDGKVGGDTVSLAI